MKGTRADIRLVELGLVSTRERARSLIMSGVVFFSNGLRVEKPGQNLPEDAVIIVKEDPNPFVSRGGLKLEKAVSSFSIQLDGVIAADVGASTGGFTDCMLKHGAKHVYAIDVGYGQLDWMLRNDLRVSVMERTNARNMSPEWFDAPLDFAATDVSFISLKLILPGMFNCLKAGGTAVALVKPQFEAGRDKVGKHGVVRDASVHMQVLFETAVFAQRTGFSLLGMDYSPITGPKGNIEFLLVLNKGGETLAETELNDAAEEVVTAAHSSLAV